MANKMKDVAELLGVELEEEFTIKDFPEKFKITENGMMFWSSTMHKWCSSSGISNALLTGKREIIKISKPILNEKEKDYLSAVIKPFKDKVRAIVKYNDVDYDNYSFIVIIVKQSIEGDDITNEGISLPVFKKGTMYNGMEIYKDYTLEELGL